MLHQLRCSTQDVVVHSFRELKARWALRNWRSPTGIMVFGASWTVTLRVEQISLLLPEQIPELYQSLYKAGGVFTPPPGGGWCSTQRGLIQRDPLSTLSKFRTRQRTRQLFCGANAESPALAGLWFWYCYVILWLRGRTAAVICQDRSAWCELRPFLYARSQSAIGRRRRILADSLILSHRSSNEVIGFQSTANSNLGLQVRPLSDPLLSRSRRLKSGPSGFKAGEVGKAVAGGV